MIEIGRLCVKTLGREAGRKCVVVDIIDQNFVIIDGDVKRRRVNIKHLEPLPIKLNIRQGADTKEVVRAMVEAGIPVSLWKIKRDDLWDLEPIFKEKFGENWKEEFKKLGSPGK